MLITFPTLPHNKNYNFLGISGSETFVVDPSVFDDVEHQLLKNNKTLDYILITHHHWDHVGGIDQLMEKYACKLIVPKNFPLKKQNIYKFVSEGDTLQIGEYSFSVMEVPGHTKDHIVYHDPIKQIAFVGDVLFRIGCGRNFEGTFEEFTHSLWKIYQLPDETMIYCAHEYTESNLRFALSLNPQNSDLLSYKKQLEKLLKSGSFSIPFKLSADKTQNPFLTVFNGLQLPSEDTVKAIKRLRMQKDLF